MRRTASWYLLLFLALGVSLYSAAALLLPAARPPLVGVLLARTPLALVAHLAGGILALAIGALQVNAGLRDRRIGLHRLLGKVYVGAVLVGGVGGLRLAVDAQGGFVSHVGFGFLAACWLVSTAAAWQRIRQDDEDGHRDWMIRSYALTLAAVTLRIYLPASVAAGLPFEPTYQAIAWLCWVPNLLVAEWVILPRVRRAPRPA